MWDAIVIFIKLRPAVEDFYHKAHAEWQDYWNKITGTRLLEQDYWNKITGTRLLEQDHRSWHQITSSKAP
jgi:hypothetical protein